MVGRNAVRKRPYLGNMTSEEGGHGCGVLTGEPNCVSSPALAVSFGKTNGGSHMLAVSDEEGYMSLFNTRRRLPSSLTCEQNTGDVRTELWRAHNNAIFDICWIRDDTRILSASGDQTAFPLQIRLWDVQARAGLGVMKGHTGSVKSLCSHPVHPDLFVSGSRDGSVAFWDVRSNSTSSDRTSEECFQKSVMDLVASKSITAVVYLKDERVVASAGAADSVVKFWDTRKLKAPIAQTPPQCQPNIEGKCILIGPSFKHWSLKLVLFIQFKHPPHSMGMYETQKCELWCACMLCEPYTHEGRVHGIASLSQDSNGAFLISSCMDNKIYLYNMLQPERGPLKSFSGHVLSSFYVKIDIHCRNVFKVRLLLDFFRVSDCAEFSPHHNHVCYLNCNKSYRSATVRSSECTNGQLDKTSRQLTLSHNVLNKSCLPVLSSCPWVHSDELIIFLSLLLAAFSPDGTHILSGSSDGNVFIWQADKPAAVPVILQGHGGEVTAVDWCPSDFCKVATCSDDYTAKFDCTDWKNHSSTWKINKQVRVWNIENSSFENQRSTPSAVRRRISAYPASVSQRLFDSIAATDSAKLHPDFLTGDSDGACADSDKSVTPQSLRNDEVTTPQSIKNVVSRALSLGSPSNRPSRNISQTGKENEALIQKTPENMKSPSSVLNPPSSSKRKTILDYFGTN
eukprot:Gb_09523 [translate_table: standard]